MILVQVKEFGTGTSYGLEILQQCDKRVKTKSQNFGGLTCTLGDIKGEKLIG